MQQDSCVFCKIVAGEIPAEKIIENEDFLAFLSINPVYEGLTIVIPKKHFGSYAYKTMSDSELVKLHLFAKKVALLLDRALGAERCVQVMEGLEIDHAHLKLFPKYAGVTHSIMETQIPVDTERIKKAAEKIRKSS